MNSKTRKLVLIFASLNFILVPFQNCAAPINSEIVNEINNESLAVVEEPPATQSPVSAPVVVQPAPAPAPVAPSPTTPTTMKTIFMATGHMGRTVMSCDDGVTWINDRSDNDAARCWVAQTDPNYVECDHTPYSSRGIDAGNGYFYANYGWGYNGSLKRSRDGKNWEVIKNGGWGGGIAWGPTRLFHVYEGGGWSYSETNGASWTKIVDPITSQFSYPAVKRLNNKIFVFGRGTKLGLSTDEGRTWKTQDIATPFNDFIEGKGLIVAVGLKHRQGLTTYGYAHVSKDNGATWSTTAFADDNFNHNLSDVVFNGSEFVTWAGDRVYKSTDGVTWTRYARKNDGLNPHPGWNYTTSYNSKTGTYVAMFDRYSNQKFYRSTDGINWTSLPTTKFKGGHPILDLITGEIDSASCP